MKKCRTIMAALILLLFLSTAGTARGGPNDEIPFSDPATERWLEKLPYEKGQKARIIFEEARPELQDLHQQLMRKMQELESLNYADGTPPESLARLGADLQHLYRRLREAYRVVRERLRTEAGVDDFHPHKIKRPGKKNFPHRD